MPLAPLTTLRIGGPAEWLVEVETAAALAALLREVRAAGAPFHLLGMGSNLLVPDAGLEGVTARLGGALAKWRCEGERVVAGAAVPLARLARRLAAAGRGGLEAFSGFPSTVGGAVVMNAGCYGVEIKDVLLSTMVLDRGGCYRHYDAVALEPGYRSTALQGGGAIVVEAAFRTSPGDARASLARIDELNKRRRASLPSGLPNAGSIFRNPPGGFAGQLIESVGLKGEVRGAAQISVKHANVFVNLGGARADDVLDLMVTAARLVAERTAIRLEPEIVLEGELRRRWEEAVREVSPEVAV